MCCAVLCCDGLRLRSNCKSAKRYFGVPFKEPSFKCRLSHETMRPVESNSVLPPYSNSLKWECACAKAQGKLGGALTHMLAGTDASTRPIYIHRYYFTTKRYSAEAHEYHESRYIVSTVQGRCAGNIIIVQKPRFYSSEA